MDRHYLYTDLLRASPLLYRDLLLTLMEARSEKWDPAFIPLEPESLDYLCSQEFSLTANFFFRLKQYYWQRLRLTEQESITSCFQAQEFLNDAFEHFRFQMGWLMASVRDIKVINQRYVLPEYENILSKLLISDIEQYLQPGNIILENNSILCYSKAEFKTSDTSLNLFPFVIDRNALAGKTSTEPDIYLYAGYYSPFEQMSPAFYFMSVERPGECWRFEENKKEVSLLHEGEEASPAHKANHLMVKTYEFNLYLSQFKKQFQL